MWTTTFHLNVDNDIPFECGQRHSGCSQVEDGGRDGPLASVDDAAEHSSNQSLAGLIGGAVNHIQKSKSYAIR